MNYTIKIARTAKEFEGIFQLNYDTFVEEIPQHHENTEKKLVDQFHDENEYVICKLDEEVIGMMAIRDIRPFSLDKKLGRIENYLDQAFERPCEIRLLSVKQKYRNGRVFASLTGALIRYCLHKGYDIAFISGTTRQSRLYKHIGFESFAHLVGHEDVLFQPMYLTKDMFFQKEHLRSLSFIHTFLPGPVMVDNKIQSVFSSQPEWHRSQEHKQLASNVFSKLKKLTNAQNVSVLTGTGTVANDAVAAQLHSLGTKGLILTNGEFGERLVDHANRFELQFDTFAAHWGQAYNLGEIRALCEINQYDWIWFVHCETSTGMLNDFEGLSGLCREYSIKLCMDAISSIGAVPLNLADVYLASGVSGKAISAVTGLSFVFFNQLELGSRQVPRYLDILYYQKCEGIPFSQNSYLFKALDMALDKLFNLDYFENRLKRFSFVYDSLKNLGFTFVVEKNQSSPCVITIAFPKDVKATDFGLDLYLNGYQVHFLNRYLIKNNWIQIALMNTDENTVIVDQLLRTLQILLSENAGMALVK
ncbi:aminotransferase class V-fold PLP-dependent enzyme [Bacillus sp. FJAT-49736]|uniref:aminotransferase class V-fold PLP-dependent enzyme n=1 Tax=Bacillus sp. FJAT-49736 TaxID=2833582 RepID=UPI001BCA2868|nr:aminotransferase class V-fold PLP-dependent enzyme [Bacillus sp. FJAT-49736]MBS4172574.1 aminotransferase class V-fold PLP-dependent enzyme [Bacillus sp. FJAT-49736]